MYQHVEYFHNGGKMSFFPLQHSVGMSLLDMPVENMKGRYVLTRHAGKKYERSFIWEGGFWEEISFSGQWRHVYCRHADIS